MWDASQVVQQWFVEKGGAGPNRARRVAGCRQQRVRLLPGLLQRPPKVVFRGTVGGGGREGSGEEEMRRTGTGVCGGVHGNVAQQFRVVGAGVDVVPGSFEGGGGEEARAIGQRGQVGAGAKQFNDTNGVGEEGTKKKGGQDETAQGTAFLHLWSCTLLCLQLKTLYRTGVYLYMYCNCGKSL